MSCKLSCNIHITSTWKWQSLALSSHLTNVERKIRVGFVKKFESSDIIFPSHII